MTDSNVTHVNNVFSVPLNPFGCIVSPYTYAHAQ